MVDPEKPESGCVGCLGPLFGILALGVFLYMSACTANVVWMGASRIVVGEAHTLPIADAIMRIIEGIFK